MQEENVKLSDFETLNKVEINDSLYQDDTQWMDSIDKQAMKDKFYINNDCFKNCQISLLAVMKMLNHACLGDKKEVMGFLLGKFTKDGYIVIDVEPIPAEASEVSVSIQNQQWQFWYDTLALREKEGKKEKLVGWYHSHPGYRPFFSGTDVTTTRLIKDAMKQIGFGIVIDHITTQLSGKLDIGAFNTWHKKFQGPNPTDEYNSQKDYKFQLRKGDKVKEFGANSDDYYDLKTTVFKNTTDNALIEVLWNKFWKNTLTKSPLFIEQDQYVKKEEQAVQTVKKAQNEKFGVQNSTEALISQEKKQPYNEGINAALDRNQGLVDEIVKNMLFN